MGVCASRRRHVHELRDRPGRGHDRPGRRLRARVPAQARDADARDPEAPGEGADRRRRSSDPGRAAPSACATGSPMSLVDARGGHRDRRTRRRCSRRWARSATTPTCRSTSCRSLTATDWPGQDPRFWVAYELRSMSATPPGPGEGGARRRRPARADRSRRCSPPRTGTSARSSTSSASCSTAIRTCTRILLPDDWEGSPAAQGRGARRREHPVPRRVHPAGRPAHDDVSDMPGHADATPRSSTRRLGSRGRDPAGDDDHQHGAAAPLDARGAAAAAGARRRDRRHAASRSSATCTPGIEKNTEYRTWPQGITYVTRADYLSPFFNELGYCLAVERLLGVEAPERAQVIRVLVCELNRICVAPRVARHRRARARRGERDALRLPRARGPHGRLRGDHRPADEPRVHPDRRRDHGPARRGHRQDPRVPAGACPSGSTSTRRCSTRTRSGSSATRASGVLTRRGRARARRHRADAPRGRRRRGPAQGHAVLRLRDVRLRRAGAGPRPTRTRGTWSASRRCGESLRIVEPVPRTARATPGPVMVEDPKVGWPSQALRSAPTGSATTRDYLRHIMEESMEALIHHFKMVTAGRRGAGRRGLQAVESPRGELGFYVVSDGGHRPYRVKIRDPSFVNLQATPDDGRGPPGRRRDRRDRIDRPRDGRGGPLMTVFEGGDARGGADDHRALPGGTRALGGDAAALPRAVRVEGHVTRDGLQEVAGAPGLTTAEVEAVATLLLDVPAASDRATTW